MIAKILEWKNLTKACQRVVSNRGSSGVDGMRVRELKNYLSAHRSELVGAVLGGQYKPSAIRGVKIPKKYGTYRLLGIPTVLDRLLQQAVSQELMTKFEYGFSEWSYGFRPGRNAQKAVQQSLSYINEGYQDIVDIDLRKFFDEVAHYKILQLIYDRVKCKTTLRLIRKWLRAPISIDGRLRKRRKGLPQEDRLNPKGRCLIDI